MSHLHIRIPIEIKKMIDYIAKKYKIDRGSVIRIAVYKFFKDVQKDEKKS